jgi:hypothetical protein
MVWAEVVVKVTIRISDTILVPSPLRKSPLENGEGNKWMDRRLLGRQVTRTGGR